ncbi:MAG: hypothetical protein HKP58_18285 [Desulfatitalea sp.]|nr:hypothetical protein [Desulfatitalea sp.]NNK02365.1 hypothetical protein [Desulfatitalea sp.]
MFLRGQIGPCPQWMSELDMSKEIAAIEKNWLNTGKMLSFNMFSKGLRMIGPSFRGMNEQQRFTFWYYTFPDVERFMEWALGAPEHMAAHEKFIFAVQEAAKAGLPPGPGPGQPGYHFHATDDPDADIPAIRGELKEMYKKIEKSDWAHVPEGSIVKMMLGDNS